MTHLPLADIGLTVPMVLLSIAIWLGRFAVIAIIAAAIGVLIFGPRKVDSLILPGLATFGVVIVALFVGRWSSATAPILLAVAAAVGVGSAAVQRFVGDRIDHDSARWPLFVRAAAIAACSCVGAFLGFVFSLGREPLLVVAVALFGAAVGWRVSRNRVAPSDDPQVESDARA